MHGEYCFAYLFRLTQLLDHFPFLARFWINTQYPKAPIHSRCIWAKKKNGLTLLCKYLSIIIF
ncbi:MAG: hypothetical protein ACD_8C00046G0002 [uncultured bacterium]|nr:MAG: hypothetical protein ACD_8C00046G0002 [uncultured bacterium]